MRKNSSVIGYIGEEQAASYLTGKGYQIIGRNFRTKFGEIDIIALKEKTLCFVEVKTRTSDFFGKPEEAVTPRKIGRMNKAAQYYIYKKEPIFKSVRYDLVSIDFSDSKKSILTHYKNITG
ncbi:hypothetical protein A2Y99_03065 [Candidatus Gottesmanbacteria bacterium RBG_13_37_7]|uniref:UPF0102 protein A2Y99_03065 n=1 Tax=Candidatus Gottesmanbacteria bacterium RBG_13_37_7 TaxID=1798369 RepID=A0A1F5YI50_9BACT|nr:MAG: hypothetical protein A2Y99_03065 [Candidatus Gottesmanbacteria bacterium RBG_13_37_7]